MKSCLNTIDNYIRGNSSADQSTGVVRNVRGEGTRTAESRLRVCLITTANLSNNPRLIKEATALQRFGYEVAVVACHYDDKLLAGDETLIANGTWSARRIFWGRNGSSGLYWFSRIRRFTCKSIIMMMRSLEIRWLPEWLAIRAFDRVIPEVMRAARKIRAELYIGHNPGMLPVAWRVATETGAKCGFDAEDLHSGMWRFGEQETVEHQIVRDWERRYLPMYDYRTTSSPLITKEYEREYSLSINASILNVFDPIDSAAQKSNKQNSALAVYWVSQTIGGHRGLEDVVRALALTKDLSIKLYLRGEWQAGYESHLRSLMDRLGVQQDNLIPLPRVGFDELVASAAQYDVGLALEAPTSRNRDLCLTNKLFNYLSAGLAIAATSTAAQSGLMENIADAGFLFSPGDYSRLADGLRAFAMDPHKLREAKMASLQAAHGRYSWSVEQFKLMDAVDALLKRDTSGSEAIIRQS